MKIIKILNYIFPLIIGALCSYMGSLTHIGKNNILQIIMIFTLSVIFSILLFYDAKTELDKLQKSYHNNYSNIITKFLILKNIVIQLFAIIIGAVCSSLGNWDKNQSGFSIKSNILIILGIIYILFVIYSIYNDEKIDSNIKKYVSNIEMLNEIYENVQTSIVCINHAIIIHVPPRSLLSGTAHLDCSNRSSSFEILFHPVRSLYTWDWKTHFRYPSG